MLSVSPAQRPTWCSRGPAPFMSATSWTPGFRYIQAAQTLASGVEPLDLRQIVGAAPREGQVSQVRRAGPQHQAVVVLLLVPPQIQGLRILIGNRQPEQVDVEAAGPGQVPDEQLGVGGAHDVEAGVLPLRVDHLAREASWSGRPTSATTLLSSAPRPSISSRISSPAWMCESPLGVPVSRMSPGSRVMNSAR